MKPLLVRLGRFWRSLFRDRGPAKPPPDPRALANPWLGHALDALGDRYQLGPDTEQGIQVLRRTGKARFNPMRAWLRPADQVVACEYEAHVSEGETVEAARGLLDGAANARLAPLGLAQVSEKVEPWHGQLVTRRYEGACRETAAVVAAVRFICEYSEQVLDSSTQ